jgi:hypothetical protein
MLSICFELSILIGHVFSNHSIDSISSRYYHQCTSIFRTLYQHIYHRSHGLDNYIFLLLQILICDGMVRRPMVALMLSLGNRCYNMTHR